MANTWGRVSFMVVDEVEKSLVEEDSRERVVEGEHVVVLSAVNFFLLVEKELLL